MKKFLAIVFVAIVGTGCATRESAVQSPCTVTIKDNETAAKVQGKMVEGSTWVWNTATQSWEWLTSDVNKERATKAWDKTKQVASETYDKAVKAYHEHK